MTDANDVFVISDEMLDKCASELSEELKKSFFKILNKKIDQYFPRKNSGIGFKETMQLMMFPGIMLTADIINALVMQSPEEDRSKNSLEWISQCNRLLDFTVSDMFVRIKKSEESHDK